METDKVEPSRAFLKKISETYGISAEWLLNGRGAMVAEEGAHPIPVQQLDPLMLTLCGGIVKEAYTKAGIPNVSDTLFEDATWVYNEVMQRVTDPTDGDELEAVLPQVKLLFGA
ncbi:MAG: helix-turn-helix transcriptional regulator [Alphaproteobacteria bacterium]|nr:helix-turn-helix transcriptional regulator [Alphaproteobacteria bacterium]